ncbi:SixA phosphatase family protein [Luteithermobacter gelatinilyticus]|uniref:SixA phosphatase family protein n=1 Tax=Luteithermobacter gelatinilyticus TaxID=2582913 RepID=UPI001106EC19|nr:histidine phosphatase family protein [Luteithermobacter gelatinilyticus]|tara:strand:- start:12171 stop:12686 length:516 start_codon:yes stop_codon:yes gene_type:complete
MKRVYLLRHAKSSHDDPDLKDINRPLNNRGVMASHLMGRYLYENALLPDYILCSPAVRTRQTLKNVLAQLDRKIPCVFEDSLYLAQPGRVIELIKAVDDKFGALMIVGHNPTINILAHDLNDGKNREDHRRLIEKYPTGALTVLDFPTDHWSAIERKAAQLERFVCPKDLI